MRDEDVDRGQFQRHGGRREDERIWYGLARGRMYVHTRDTQPDADTRAPRTVLARNPSCQPSR